MKRLLILLLSLAWFSACQSDSENKDSSDLTPILTELENCAGNRSFLAKSTFRLTHGDLVMGFSGENEEAPENPGASYRTFEVFQVNNCEQVFRQTLPVNQPPTLPYRFAEIVYNNTSKLVGIKGADRIWCYDINKNELIPPLIPQFKITRNALGGKPGLLRKLEVWEKYLIGYVDKAGVFLFDLQNVSSPRVVFPIAEHAVSDEQYRSLFALPLIPEGKVQLIIPYYDENENSLIVNPLLSPPMDANGYELSSLQEGAFILLKSKNQNRLVDMERMQMIALPKELLQAELTAIQDWLKKE